MPTSRLSLRQAQRAVTEQRIIEALAALIDDEHPLEISMAAVARRAAVSEPTLYRHFPTKRHLFAALAAYQFQTVAAGLAPASAGDLADAVRIVFERSAGMENLIRWTLASTDPQRVPRPNVQARLDMLRTALGIQPDTGDDAQFLLRAALLLTSPMAWLYWNDLSRPGRGSHSRMGHEGARRSRLSNGTYRAWARQAWAGGRAVRLRAPFGGRFGFLGRQARYVS
jgi:AcrR family transcriptional regulator